MSCIAPRDGAVRHHKLRGDQAVRNKTESRHQRSIATTQNKASHADSAVIANDCSKRVPAGCRIQIGNRDATSNRCFGGFRVHRAVAHGSQVENEAALPQGSPNPVLTAIAHRHWSDCLRCQQSRANTVRRGTSRDEGWRALDRTIPETGRPCIFSRTGLVDDAP